MACVVFGYGQASIDPSVPSTYDQEAFVRSAFDELTKAGRFPPGSVWAGFVRDDWSRKPVKLRQRQGGSLLLAGLGPEHVVMAASHDRIFANVNDACETIEHVHRVGSRLLILDYGLDTSAPEELLLPIAGMMKALKGRERRRTKEAFEHRKQLGMPAGGKAPIGWEIVRANLDGIDRAYFVPHYGARRLAQFIVEHYERWRGTFEQTAYRLNAQKVVRPDGKPWRRTAVFNWYHAAKRGFPLPNGRRKALPIPIGAGPAHAYRRIVPDDED